MLRSRHENIVWDHSCDYFESHQSWIFILKNINIYQIISRSYKLRLYGAAENLFLELGIISFNNNRNNNLGLVQNSGIARKLDTLQTWWLLQVLKLLCLIPYLPYLVQLTIEAAERKNRHLPLWVKYNSHCNSSMRVDMVLMRVPCLVDGFSNTWFRYRGWLDNFTNLRHWSLSYQNNTMNNNHLLHIFKAIQ